MYVINNVLNLHVHSTLFFCGFVWTLRFVQQSDLSMSFCESAESELWFNPQN